MDEFSRLLARYHSAIDRYVHLRISSFADAEDVLQEICLTAYSRFDDLRDQQAFLAWMIAIARSKCTDYFRAKARRLELPMEITEELLPGIGLHGRTQRSAVRETLSKLANREKQILYLYYFQNMPQTAIAKRLHIPLGTVKSRLHAAKARFRSAYPYPPREAKGENIYMTKLPEFAPAYTISPTDKAPFDVRWEELMGWLIVPRVGEKLSWGLYEQPSGLRTEYTELSVIGKAEVHGIEGVEIIALQHDASDYYRTGSIKEIERHFVAQLTDTHCRYLAESHVEDGVHKFYTFLDGEAFMNNWGFGKDNCGNEVHLHRKGMISRNDSIVTCPIESETLDIVGCYDVTINGKTYDTVCVMDVCSFGDAIVCESYIDRNGRTVLWRRFNRDDWALDSFGPATWSERLPENERLTVNGQTFVHWYDCISDYIL